MANKNIEKILCPKSVAVIGASSKTNSVGFAVFNTPVSRHSSEFSPQNGVFIEK